MMRKVEKAKDKVNWMDFFPIPNYHSLKHPYFGGLVILTLQASEGKKAKYSAGDKHSVLPDRYKW